MNALTMFLLVAAAETLPGQGEPPSVRIEVKRAGPDMVLRWNEVALQAIRAEKTPPPIAARHLAILHLAIYDAVMAIERTHQPYLMDASAPAGASTESAVVAAAQRALSGLFPRQRQTFDLIAARCWADMPKGAECDPGAALGRFVAERMLEARCNDGSDNVGQYTYKTAAGSWRPTAPLFKEPLLPEWGYVKPFAIKKGTQHRPAGPPALTSLQFGAAFNEVKRLGGKQSQLRTDEQTQIAYFWEDNVGTVTPPGHWNRIAQAIAQDRGNTLAENARVFAHLNISLADAGVLCWVIKFTFDFWRPITAIREMGGDEKWTPLLETPPFPAYVSGHSTFSGAAAASLAQSFGADKIRFTTTSDGLPGVTRTFTSLWAAAEEAGMSRIYGGIHWQFDNVDGLKVGRTLGEYVSKNTLQPRPRNVERRALYFEPPIIIVR
jgi:hypothetical protein